MGSSWTVLAALFSLSHAADGAASARETLLDAKDSVVESAMAMREARLDWEVAEAVVDEAEASVRAARIAREKALEHGPSRSEALVAVSAAEKAWRKAFLALEAQAARLGQAEARLRASETALEQASALPRE
jgi:BioD-like phosphotransacetylase family protein